MMSIWDKQIEKTIQEELFVDIWRDCFDDELIFGQIMKRSQDFMFMTEYYGADGEFRAISIFRIADISRVRWGGRERDCVEKLVRRKGIVRPEIDIDMTSIKTILENVYSHYKHVTINVEELDTDICFIGEILEIDESHVLLKEYGTHKGMDRSELLIRLEDISKVEASGKYEMGLLYLFGEDENAK